MGYEDRPEIVDSRFMDDIHRSIRRSAVGIYKDGLFVGEIFRKACLGGAHHVAYRMGIIEARDPDEYVGFTDLHQPRPYIRSPDDSPRSVI